MCYTERFQHLPIDGAFWSWTFRTVHLPEVKNIDCQTLHFECVNGDCSIAIAWSHSEIAFLKLTIITCKLLPRWSREWANDEVYKLYLREYPSGNFEMSAHLREFLLHTPEFIDLIGEMNGNVLSVEDTRFANLERQLAAAST